MKLTEKLYFGIHPGRVEPEGIPQIDHYVSLVEPHKFPIKDGKAPTLKQLRTMVEKLQKLEGVKVVMEDQEKRL